MTYPSTLYKVQKHNLHPAMKRECKKHNLCKDLQQEDRSTLAGTAGKTDMVCIFAPIQEGTLGMAREEDLEGNSLHQGIDPKPLFNHNHHQLSSHKS